MTDIERPAYRDRNNHYMPDKLTDSRVDVEVRSEVWPYDRLLRAVNESDAMIATLARIAVENSESEVVRDAANRALRLLRTHERLHAGHLRGALAMGLADELNRDTHGLWRWVRIDSQTSPVMRDGEPTISEHWSHFDGHIVQVDVDIHTSNDRVVNHWKGRDEVRGGCFAHIHLNRRLVYEVDHARDALEMLLIAREKIKQLLNHSAFTHWTQAEFDRLVGRKIYYHDQPAVVKTVYDTYIMIVGDPGPIRVAWMSEECAADEDEHKTDILDPHIWWWRD